MRKPGTLFLLICVALPAALAAQGGIAPAEYETRRQQIMQHIPDGILLLHARSFLSGEDALYPHGFQQNAGFFYLTGLARTIGAILAVDGVRENSILFVPDSLSGFAGRLPGTTLEPGTAAATRLGVSSVRSWNEFVPWLTAILAANPQTALYLDESYWAPPPESNPPGLLAVDERHTLWRQALAARWPDADLRSAKSLLTEQRLIKSPAEIAQIREVARVSAAALLAGIRAIRPGVRQRIAEAAVVCGCIEAGGEGPSFWPWVMSGENAVFPKPFESLVDYHHLDKTMQAGELVRVDVGCDAGFYKGDVGRTVPVSGSFTASQREIWNAFIRIYRAGLKTIRAGSTKTQLERACEAEAKNLQQAMKTPEAQKAIAILSGAEPGVSWHVHGSGLEPGEGRPAVFEAGMVIEFEPMFSVEGMAFYLEDMLLVTESGYELLTEGLPYTAEEIEAVMRAGR